MAARAEGTVAAAKEAESPLLCNPWLFVQVSQKIAVSLVVLVYLLCIHFVTDIICYV